MADLNFKEERFRSFFHDFSIWIFGVEVTDQVQGSLSWSLVEKDGSNAAQFTLNNAQDKWTITEENIKQKLFRQPDGEFDEKPKQKMLAQKEKLQEQDPKTQGKLYPFDIGRLIFHKMDPVRIFIHNPLTTADEWLPVFCGFIENYETTLDFITGESIINIQCNDLRNAVLQKLRIALNLPGQVIESQAKDFAETAFESQARKGRTVKNSKGEVVSQGGVTVKGAFIDIGLFNDVLISNDQLNDALANKRFEEVIEEMILGTINGLGNPDRKKGVGTISKGPNSVGPLRPNRTKQWPTFDSGQSLEEWYKKCLFGFENDGFLTFSKVKNIGQLTVPNGKYSPFGSGVSLNILLPKEGTGAGSLVEFSNITQNTFQIDWQYRLDRILEFCNRLDYQFWINGFGDIIFEFPMYDFNPDAFGKFSSVLNVNFDMIRDSITDEAQEVYNMVIATGGFAYEPENFQGDDARGTIPKAIVINSIMMKRYGVVSYTISLPYIAKGRGTNNEISEKDLQTKLREFAMLEMQKSWVKANNMTSDFAYRPFILPNKPVEFKHRKRRGLVYNVNNSMELFGECSTNLDLKYIRTQDENGIYRTIGGQETMPISYNKLFIDLEGRGIQFLTKT